jgi:hypothetical protein
VWQVFPFDFSDYSINWAAIAHLILVLGIVGSCIGILVQLVTLIRLAVVGGDSVGVRGEVRFVWGQGGHDRNRWRRNQTSRP